MVRLAKPGDLPRILELYAIARAYMARSGNPNQWPETYPGQELLEGDMERASLYVVERGGMVCGAFVLALGEDAGYAAIRDGAWLRDGPYGTIHRLAGDGVHRGIFEECMDFCRKSAPDLRADTHADNRIMQHLLEKNGFTRCGIIHVADGTPRIAYQKMSLTLPMER